MLRLALTFAALLALCYMVADKAKIPEYSRAMNVWARPLAVIGVALVALMVFAG